MADILSSESKEFFLKLHGWDSIYSERGYNDYYINGLRYWKNDSIKYEGPLSWDGFGHLAWLTTEEAFEIQKKELARE